MVKPQRIVVGVDVDGSTDLAVTAAIELAQRFHAEFEMVHAVPSADRLSAEQAEGRLAQARRAVRVHLEASLPGAMLPYVSEEHHLLVRAGAQGEVLLARASEPGAGLLVLGAHRRRGLLDLRSTAHYLLARAPCPVWVQAGEVRPVRRILVPVDLSDESLAALARACRWGREFGASVTALSCFETPEFAYGPDGPAVGPTYVLDHLREDSRAAFEKVMAGFEWGEVPHATLFQESHPVAAILAHQDEADLIMLGTHGRTGLSALLLGSVANSVVREAHVPVVTLRAGSRRWLRPD
ncbi:MAG TPA: universal stress protein [Planctomycetota bacterium]|nr:universal stress protein [Planctomycetota bacterium]